MATPTYTATEIKQIVLEQVNKIKGIESEFDVTDSDNAYATACMECGFEVPESTDSDKDKKNYWLMHRMRTWYLKRLWEQYALRFKVGDIEAQQIAYALEKLCKKMDDEFATAKTSEESIHLFMESGDVFGSQPLLLDTGLVEDRIGQDISERT